MDRFEVRREVERAFAKDGKNELYNTLDPSDIYSVIDVLWDYMNEADNSHVLKRELEELRKRIHILNNKSGQRVKCIKYLGDRRALVQLGMFKEEVLVSPSVIVENLKTGAEVLIVGAPEGRMIAGVKKQSLNDGKIIKIQRVLDNDRFVIEEGNNLTILKCAYGVTCKKGDEVRYDPESRLIFEVIDSNETSSYLVHDLPEQRFDDVKGLEKEKQYIIERLISPLVYKEKFSQYKLPTIRAALFHGASGNGKTFLAGAIFNEILDIKAKICSTLKEKTDQSGFFVINGPEVLSKWSGLAEATIREIFAQARVVAKRSGFPSLIFWDEIDSIAGKRKDTATYSPEKTIVPTLLAEIQGLSSGHDVVLIAATNRPDILDPALMRAGRLGDLILEIPKPTKQASLDILEAEFKNRKVPHSLKKLINRGLSNEIISHVYENQNPLAFAKTRSGSTKKLMREEIVNGSIFSQIGGELVRKSCIAEINDESFVLKDAIKMLDEILYSQIGVLDSGVKCGFTIDTSDIIVDVAINS